MAHNSFEIRTPSRLHFGLFGVGSNTKRRFGGAGLMVEDPATRILFAPSEQLEIDDRQRERIGAAVNVWFDQYGQLVPTLESIQEIPLAIRIQSAPPTHSGFGSGTQLTLGIAAGLFHHFGLPIPKPEELSPAMGRGNRSAIGSHGFFTGGMLVDRGKGQGDSIAELDIQVSFPEEWRIVIALLNGPKKVFGKKEASAFIELPDSTESRAVRLRELVAHELLPAVMSRDCSKAGQAIYELNYGSGELFAAYQGGPYNGPEIEELVQRIRTFGIAGVGQSSWGPSVYALTPDNETAIRLSDHLQQTYDDRCSVTITKAINRGVQAVTVD